jgi:hypothetical protein
MMTKLPRSVKRLFPKVLHVTDAKSPIEILVNTKDCKDAQKLNPSECALARAAKRELHADGIIIGMSSSYVIRGNKAIRYHTPESVQREIVSFDRHNDFAPGKYQLIPKSPANRFNVSKREPRSNEDKTVRRKVHHSARIRILPTGAE